EELLSGNTSKYIPFVSGFLDNPDPQVKSHAAISLGQSQYPAALDISINKWKLSSDVEFSRDLLTAVALIRLEKAADFLISLLSELGETANDALESLTYSHVPGIQDRIKRIVYELDDSGLKRQFDRTF